MYNIKICAMILLAMLISSTNGIISVKGVDLQLVQVNFLFLEPEMLIDYFYKDNLSRLI